MNVNQRRTLPPALISQQVDAAYAKLWILEGIDRRPIPTPAHFSPRASWSTYLRRFERGSQFDVDLQALRRRDSIAALSPLVARSNSQSEMPLVRRRRALRRALWRFG